MNHGPLTRMESTIDTCKGPQPKRSTDFGNNHSVVNPAPIENGVADYNSKRALRLNTSSDSYQTILQILAVSTYSIVVPLMVQM